MMEITQIKDEDQERWNKFIHDNYPPVGAFMQTYEWTRFREAFGYPVYRFFVFAGDEVIAAFALTLQPLPFGLTYGYIARGPVFAKSYQDQEQTSEILKIIRSYLVREFTHLIFVRLEPPLAEVDISSHGFIQPDYYIQPRYNHVIDLRSSEEEIINSFHPSTRSNINRGERRGVVIKIKDHTTHDAYQDFITVAKDTINRNRGIAIYPSDSYFSSLFKILPPYDNNHVPEKLSLATFYGYQGSDLATIHFVLFFGRTATYLYGASSTNHLSSKVTTLLHYRAMCEARDRGLDYYDLGGIDEKLWPSLTRFKRQFRGKEFSYIGNIDIVFNQPVYFLYNLFQKFKRLFK